MYKKILMPVDVFEMNLSDKAVRHAEFLAKADNASITLLNILPIKKFEAYMVSESEKKMNELKRLFDIAPENIHTEVRFGNVRDEIISMSNKDDYEVIVIGSKTPGLSSHLLGSNAESVIRYAKIPVLVVR